MRLKTYDTTLWEIKNRRNPGGTTFRIPCLGVYHVVETPFYAILPRIFPVKSGEPSLRSTVKGSNGMHPEWEKDTAANGTQICWLITAEPLYGRHQKKKTETKKRK